MIFTFYLAKLQHQLISGQHKNLSFMTGFFDNMLTEEDKVLLLRYENSTHVLPPIESLLSSFNSIMIPNPTAASKTPHLVPGKHRSKSGDNYTLLRSSSDNNDSAFNFQSPESGSESFYSSGVSTLAGSTDYFDSELSRTPMYLQIRSTTPPLLDDDDNRGDLIFGDTILPPSNEDFENFVKSSGAKCTQISSLGNNYNLEATADGKLSYRYLTDDEELRDSCVGSKSYVFSPTESLVAAAGNNFINPEVPKLKVTICKSNDGSDAAKISITSISDVGDKKIELGYHCILTLSKYYSLPYEQQKLLNLPELNKKHEMFRALDPVLSTWSDEDLAKNSKELFENIANNIHDLQSMCTSSGN